MSENMIYEKSNMPAKPGEPTRDIGPRADQGPVTLQHSDPVHGDALDYPSLSGQGFDVVEFPLMRAESSPHKIETLQAREVADRILHSVEGGLATGDAPSILSWYLGCLKGCKLLTPAGESAMQKLADSFARTPNREEFFESQIRPFVETLRPQRRQP